MTKPKMMAEIHKHYPRLNDLAVKRMVNSWGISSVFGNGPMPKTVDEIKSRVEHDFNEWRKSTANIPGGSYFTHPEDALNESAEELHYESRAS